MGRRDESGRGVLPDLPPSSPAADTDPDPVTVKEGSAAAAPSAPRPEDRALARRITKVYSNANLFGLVRWLLSIFVLGFAGRVLAVGRGIPSLLPLAGFNVACASLNILLLLAQLAMRPASPTTPRPAGWYVALLVGAPVMWVAAVATGLDMTCIARKHNDEQEPGLSSYRPGTDTSSLVKVTVLCASFSFAALLSCLVQCYHLSKLKRDNFTAEEIRCAYDLAARRKERWLRKHRRSRHTSGT